MATHTNAGMVVEQTRTYEIDVSGVGAQTQTHKVVHEEPNFADIESHKTCRKFYYLK